MAQTSKISRNNTKITIENDYRSVTLHSTMIFEAHRIAGNNWRITIRHGGYTTVTTATRLRQIANEWHVPFTVSRADGKFSVYRWQGDPWNEMEVRPSIPSGDSRFGFYRPADEYVFEGCLCW